MPSSWCPKEEKLLEFLSIRDELAVWEKLSIHFHLIFHRPCRTKLTALAQHLESFDTPEPDVTESILSVYQRLKHDETLILKGWKLGNVSKSSQAFFPVNFFRLNFFSFKSIAWGSFALLFVISFVFLGKHTVSPSNALLNTSKEGHRIQEPVAQIRLEDKNRVEVHYIQPELLQMVEFETAH